MGDHWDDTPPWDDHDIENAAEDHYDKENAKPDARSRPASQSVPAGTLNALYKIERESGKSYWLRIGTAFPNRNGNGFTLNLDALPLNFNGKILLARPLK